MGKWKWHCLTQGIPLHRCITNITKKRQWWVCSISSSAVNWGDKILRLNSLLELSLQLKIKWQRTEQNRKIHWWRIIINLYGTLAYLSTKSPHLLSVFSKLFRVAARQSRMCVVCGLYIRVLDTDMCNFSINSALWAKMVAWLCKLCAISAQEKSSINSSGTVWQVVVTTI